MGAFVTTGAVVTCTFGVAPVPLTVNPARTVFIGHMQKANIMDFTPLMNIASFGMCSAPTNPAVIAATSAALGVFTPAPCVPAIVSPWIPGWPQVMVQGSPALTDDSRNVCMWLGQISIGFNGQMPPIPPMCMAPPGKPNFSMAMPLVKTDFDSAASGGGGGGPTEEQYQKDLKKAGKAGKHKDMMGKGFDDLANEYQRQQDSEKAQMCLKQRDNANYCSANMSNEAQSEVNQCYRDILPPAQKDMDLHSKEDQAEYWRKRQDIEQRREEKKTKREEQEQKREDQKRKEQKEKEKEQKDDNWKEETSKKVKKVTDDAGGHNVLRDTAERLSDLFSEPENQEKVNKVIDDAGGHNVMRDTARQLEEFFTDKETQEELRQLKEGFVNKGKQTSQKVKDVVNTTTETVQDLKESGKEKGKEIINQKLNDLEKKVEEHDEDIKGFSEAAESKPLSFESFKEFLDF